MNHIEGPNDSPDLNIHSVTDLSPLRFSLAMHFLCANRVRSFDLPYRYISRLMAVVYFSVVVVMWARTAEIHRVE